jgi:Carbohydrate binding domain/PEP-CTERM motif
MTMDKEQEMNRASSKLVARAIAAMAVAAAPWAGAAGLVVNGDFETGTLAGWTQSGNTDFSGVDPFAAHSGAFGAFFGPESAGALSQTLTTVAGTSYKVDFWLELDDSAQPNLFSWTWGGAAQSPSFSNAAAFDYTEYSATVTATGASTALSFSFTNPQSFWLLDDVSVTAVTTPVPEPENFALLGVGLAALAWRRRRSK